jgi:photosystem II stability/assembly factor-like uncharacterized protein
MATPYKAGQASLWLQRYGPNTAPVYLGCHEAEGPSQDKGELNVSYCPDPARSGGFKSNGTWVGEPGLPEATVRTNISAVLDELEKADCRGTLFVHKVLCGRRDLFTNWQRSFALHAYHLTSEAYSDMASRTPGDEAESMYEAPMQAEALYKFWAIKPYRQGNSGLGDLLAIASCSTPKCADECGPVTQECEDLVAVGKPLAASAADKATILISHDAGATWAAAAADPFAALETISAVACFAIDATTTRIIVARGTTDAGNPAEIAYSDNGGVSWTLVNVGSTNGQYVLESEGLFELDPYHIWLVTNDGYVYFSADAGITWTNQEDGALSVQDFNCVMFEPSGTAGFVVGVANAILGSSNGGVGWAVVAGPAGQAAVAIKALHVVDATHVWIGYGDGKLYFSDDAGVTWTQRVWGGLSGTGVINDIAFTSPLEGWLIHDTAGPVGSLWRTIDGGYTWQQVSGMPTNTGLNSIVGCGPNHVHIVGDVQGGTPVILDVSEAA